MSNSNIIHVSSIIRSSHFSSNGPTLPTLSLWRKEFSQNQKDHVFIEIIAQNRISFPEAAKELRDRIQKDYPGKEFLFSRLLVISHGHPDALSFGDTEYRKEAIQEEDFGPFAPDGEVMLMSCKTANGFAASLARKIKRRVAAPSDVADVSLFMPFRSFSGHLIPVYFSMPPASLVTRIFNKEGEEEFSLSQKTILSKWEQNPLTVEHLYVLGRFYKDQGNFDRAVSYFRTSALQDFPYSQVELANRYYFGEGVAKDDLMAFDWYLKACRKEHKIAVYNLGIFFLNGFGVAQNFEKAATWFEIAAERGFAKAQHKLALLYLHGQGVNQDFQKAANLWEMASQQGLAEAQRELALLYLRGQGVQPDLRKAVPLLETASQQGLAEAQRDLAFLYLYGQGVPQNSGKAVSLLTTSAQQGLAAAQYDLGALYLYGQVVPQDLGKAANLWKMAAQQGLAEAQRDLAFLYLYGQGVSQNSGEAVSLLTTSAQQGLAAAQYDLGALYLYGHGVAQDFAEAAKWFEMAAQQGHAGAQQNLATLNRQRTSQAAKPPAKKRSAPKNSARVKKRTQNA